MRRINPQPIEKIIKKFFETNPQMADKLAEARLIDYWSNGKNSIISHYTHNVFIKNRILYAKLNSPALKNELMMQREKKVVELNETVGRNIIDYIIFI